jgi:hypothetical protein
MPQAGIDIPRMQVAWAHGGTILYWFSLAEVIWALYDLFSR